MISHVRSHLNPLLLLPLVLAALISACGTAITANSSPTPTSTSVSTQEIRGIFHEYPLPSSQFGPGTITTGPDGNLWFTEVMIDQNLSVKASKIARFTPTVTVTEFSLPAANTSASGIITGPDGNLWFTEGSKIARITTTGKISEFTLPPSTYAQSLVTGPDGNLWFTEQSKIGRMTLTGKVSEYSLPFHKFPAGPNPIKEPASSGQNEPLGITAGADGNLWFTEIGRNVAYIGRITPAGKITEFLLPSAGAFPSSITAGADGNLWFTEIGTNNEPSKIGVMTPQGKIHEFTLSHYILGSITSGPDGNLWFAEFQYGKTGKIARMTPTGKINEYTLPTSGNGPISITFGKDHTLWFTEVEVADPFGKNGKIGHLI